MSQVYNHEPPTKGKVVLHTTLGDVEIELWPKEAPKVVKSHTLTSVQAVRNFCQLCIEGYYDDTIFHRVVKDFLIQGGDPTGEGQGGESIYGREFKDEFHSRLKFTHRGLVACANRNTPNSNGSQFFFTLERCDHLDRKNTIFGRVAGDTIFNVVRVGEVDVDDNDRPIDPPRITSVDVIMPPFDDIIPRTSPAERAAADRAKREAERAAAIAARRKTGKALTKLSFGDEVEEDEEELEQARERLRFRSAHETMTDDSRLEQVAPGSHDAEVEKIRQKLADEQRAKDALEGGAASTSDALTAIKERTNTAAMQASNDSFATAMLKKAHARSQVARGAKDGTTGSASTRHPADNEAENAAIDQQVSGDEEGSDDDSDADKQPSKKRKIDKLKFSKAGAGVAAKKRAMTEIADAALLTSYQASLAKFKQHKRARGGREKDILQRLHQFTTLLKQKPAAILDGRVQDTPAADDGVRGAESRVRDNSRDGDGDTGYDGKVNKKIDHRSYLPAAWRIDAYIDDDDDEADDFTKLRGHKLTWNAADQVADPTQRKDDVDNYVVVDPLLEAGKAKFNKQQQHAKKRANEWAGKANL